MQERNACVLSLIETAAMVEVNKVSEENKEWNRVRLLTRSSRESWFAPYSRLVQLRTKPVFYRILGKRMTFHDAKDLSLVRNKIPRDPLMSDWRELPLALSQEVMTDGLHYAEFTAVRGGHVELGIVRPAKGWDGKIGLLDERSDFIHHCVKQQSMGVQGFNGHVHSYFYEPGVMRRNEVIGLYLDLHRGELSIWRNCLPIGLCLGGLRGHYCWAVSIRNNSHTIIKIGRAPWAVVDV